MNFMIAIKFKAAAAVYKRMSFEELEVFLLDAGCS
jgi:hypothetical protein